MECLQRYPFITAAVIATVLSIVLGFVMQATLLKKSHGGPRAYVLGILECIIFMAAFSGASAMGAAWLAFKVASKWKSWSLISEIKNGGDEEANRVNNATEIGRQYRNFLIGTAGNIVIGLASAGISAALRGNPVPWG